MLLVRIFKIFKIEVENIFEKTNDQSTRVYHQKGKVAKHGCILRYQFTKFLKKNVKRLQNMRTCNIQCHTLLSLSHCSSIYWSPPHCSKKKNGVATYNTSLVVNNNVEFLNGHYVVNLIRMLLMNPILCFHLFPALSSFSFFLYYDMITSTFLLICYIFILYQ